MNTFSVINLLLYIFLETMLFISYVKQDTNNILIFGFLCIIVLICELGNQLTNK